MPPRRASDTAETSLLLQAALGPAAGGSREAPGRRGPLYWLPVAVTLGLFCQVALLGLRPALRESARLARAEGHLVQAYEAEALRAESIERVLRAQSDPIFLERERRLLIDADDPLRRR